MSAVSVKDISKSFGSVQALNNISFEVPEGCIFGIIGPDGAGKTSLFRILTTLMLPDKGDAFVDGSHIKNDYRLIRKKIGYMPGKFSLYQDLTVEENLNFFATLFNTTIEENYYLIEDIYKQIEPFRKRRAGKLSGGMKQKLALSCALIHKPKVLFLDEPTTGVDPVSRKEFWEMLKKLKEQNITILVSTPYMDEASLCDYIALMRNGSFMQIDTPDNIVARYSETLWAVKGDAMFGLFNDLRSYNQVKTCFTFGDALHAAVDKSLTMLDLRNYLEQKGHTNINIQEIKPSIEDCFMLMTETQA
ncbi:ABC transporter ATP-binding protein [Dysgonomonas sp. 216]|uniref:ABC transporter ATP-binding protein n=1 Tax=Dysgonomonas sp. 216 TaxID=2302934 RepID=UPI0013D5DA9A|nr:ABC transporter ATP-binding protein [Dysgonomonas sp. 216]NDW18254.1 ABC transporter ATP-binding protein [Dysgonomonas sp. 216]